MTVRPAPDLEAEREVDLGRYATAVAARWWLPLLGLVAGLVAGYALSLGGTQVYRASAVVYPGQPIAAGGGLLPGAASAPANARQVLTSDAVVARAAAASGLRPRQVRSGLTVQIPAATGPRAAQPALMTITVKGRPPGKVARAANELARIGVRQLSTFVDAKIATLAQQLAAAETALAAASRSIDLTTAAVRRPGLTATDRVALTAILSGLEARRATLTNDVLNARQLLTQAREYERARVVARAVPRETAARSRRNSLVVAGTIGLLLGLAAALVWDALPSRATRRA